MHFAACRRCCARHVLCISVPAQDVTLNSFFYIGEHKRCYALYTSAHIMLRLTRLVRFGARTGCHPRHVLCASHCVFYFGSMIFPTALFCLVPLPSAASQIHRISVVQRRTFPVDVDCVCGWQRLGEYHAYNAREREEDFTNCFPIVSRLHMVNFFSR